MSGSPEGGKLAAKRNKEKYGEDFYKKIGAMGGAASNTGGFYADRELASRAGKLGGKATRRKRDE